MKLLTQIKLCAGFAVGLILISTVVTQQGVDFTVRGYPLPFLTNGGLHVEGMSSIRWHLLNLAIDFVFYSLTGLLALSAIRLRISIQKWLILGLGLFLVCAGSVFYLWNKGKEARAIGQISQMARFDRVISHAIGIGEVTVAMCLLICLVSHYRNRERGNVG